LKGAFRVRDVEALVGEMTLEEKAALTAGANFWSTAGIERLGIPPVWMTDGPNGARGAALGGEGRALTAACVPCGAALGATWDPALVERIGVLVGAEARTKGCRVLLAPTVNLHRSPLGGRNFESYSEDPLLAGTLAVAYVRGVQSQDVATTVKHFAGNESEFERMTMDAVIDERTLRELYLLPFELAVRDGGALGVMTAYNRLNGVYCSDSEHLLRDILRTEWGFEGFVVTDWGACGTTAGAARAGVDLEMPGPGRFYGPALVDAVKSGDVDEAAVDDAVRRLLRVFARIGALRDPVERVPTSVDRPEDRALAREAAAAGTVLMKNDDALLPLDAESIRTLAVIGPNAARVEIMGGGSAHLPAHYQVSPLRALQDRLGDRVTLLHEPGVDTSRLAPVLADADLSAGDGLLLEVFEGHDFAGAVVERSRRTHTEITFLDPNTAPTRPEFSVRAAAGFTPTDSGPHTFSLAQLGHARLLVDGVVRLDGMTDPPPPGTSFLGFGSAEMTTSVDLQGGRAVELVVEFANVGAPRLSGVRIGCRRPAVPDRLERAVSAAAGADAAVVIVGTGHEWESEGHDRMSMSLPGEQDELIERVLAVNLRTVVVLNAGSVVTMPWAEKARAVLQIWFGGQEMSNALVDVLFGDADPGGRLPTTVPMCLEHNPSYGNFPAENGRLRYGEGGLVGYRWYDTRRLPTRFPFGHGLSYTNFAIGEPRLSAPTFTPGGTLTVDVPVTNTAARAGSEVVQCYVAPTSSRLTRPSKELKAFAKVRLEPGETTVVRLTLDDRSFAYWDDGDSQPADGSVSRPLWMMQPTSTNTRRGWRIEAGTYELRIGRSSSDITHVLPLDIGGQWCD
jgi:beta-glucosidase